MLFTRRSTTETLYVLPTEIMSECAYIFDHRDQVALLAIESPYTYLSATAVRAGMHALTSTPASMG